MSRLLLFLLLPALLLSPLSTGPSKAAVRSVEVRGTVIGFDQGTSLIALNTRLGARSFLVTSRTLVLLNNRSASANNIAIGDEAIVNYQYETSTANTIHLIRRIRRSGTVGTVTDNSLQFRISRRASLQLQLNDASEVLVEGIPVDEPAVLTGLKAKAVVEPGSLLLLTLKASSRATRGRLAAVDFIESTITITGRRNLTLPVDPLATIRRNGSLVGLEELTAGDRVRVAFVKQRGVFRVLAIEATGVVNN
jgi:hypothetical protein